MTHISTWFWPQVMNVNYKNRARALQDSRGSPAALFFSRLAEIGAVATWVSMSRLCSERHLARLNFSVMATIKAKVRKEIDLDISAVFADKAPVIIFFEPRAGALRSPKFQGAKDQVVWFFWPIRILVFALVQLDYFPSHQLTPTNMEMHRYL